MSQNENLRTIEVAQENATNLSYILLLAVFLPVLAVPLIGPIVRESNDAAYHEALNGSGGGNSGHGGH
jgi:hypothetical protein